MPTENLFAVIHVFEWTDCATILGDHVTSVDPQNGSIGFVVVFPDRASAQKFVDENAPGPVSIAVLTQQRISPRGDNW